MKKMMLVALVMLTSIFTITAPLVSAHELLPKNVTEYIKNNPDASPEEIKRYIATSAPEFSDKVQSSQDVINIVNQKTNFFDNAWDFLKLGVKHILGGPDHILFVLSLLLVFAGIANVLRYTLTFTVAHSITLILAGTGILTLSSGIVEPVIALSIAVVALGSVYLVNNKYFKDIRSKLSIIFFFGLFHGLGFAGLLHEINIPQDKFIASLLSFNIGIEIGQLFIVALALPFVYLLKDKSWYPIMIKIVAVIIAAIAILWFFERILG